MTSNGWIIAIVVAGLVLVIGCAVLVGNIETGGSSCRDKGGQVVSYPNGDWCEFGIEDNHIPYKIR